MASGGKVESKKGSLVARSVIHGKPHQVYQKTTLPSGFLVHLMWLAV
jgi:hypothetical protein